MNNGQQGFSAPNGVLRGNWSSLPAAGLEGQLFLPDDSCIAAYHTGAKWQPFGPLWQFTDPSQYPWDWVNQGTTTKDASRGGLFLNAPSGQQLRVIKKAVPSTIWTATFAFMPLIGGQTLDALMGPCMRQSSDGKLYVVEFFQGTSAPKINISKWTNATTFSADSVTYSASLFPFIVGNVVFCRIGDNGTNKTFELSYDGFHWYLLYSVVRTDFMTPDEYGFYVAGPSSGTPIPYCACWLLSVKEN